MRAMQITGLVRDAGQPGLLSAAEIDRPAPGPREILLSVHACAVCHTELDEIEGRLSPGQFPMTPGHQVVGTVVAEGSACTLGLSGQRVGVAWINHACGNCKWCTEGRENLCPEFRATGLDAPGGYAEYMTVDEAFAHPLPESLDEFEAAPLLCAGAVGYRALRLCELRDGEVLGLTGFGASGHLILQMAKALYPNSPVYVFARDSDERQFAMGLGADWAGNTQDQPPHAVDAIVDTTPAWLPVVSALQALAPGGRLVINAIRKEAGDRGALQGLDYENHLWREKVLRTVANVTREDVRACLDLAATGALKASFEVLPLEQANEALKRLRGGGLRGSMVLSVSE